MLGPSHDVDGSNALHLQTPLSAARSVRHASEFCAVSRLLGAAAPHTPRNVAIQGVGIQGFG